MSLFKDYAPGLYNKGYDVLPIPPGTKGVKVKGWQKIDITKAQINKWNIEFPGAGVGIRCGKVVALDFDIYDRGVSVLMSLLFEDKIIRYGAEPKFLVPFRVNEKFTKKKIIYEDLFGQQHAVELLATGQQFVSYHIHPDTKKPYFYADRELSDVNIEDLPLLTVGYLEKVFDIFSENAEHEGWTLVSNTLTGNKPNGRDNSDDAIANYKPPLDLDDGQISEILQGCDATAYESWVRTGAAIHHQTGGSQEGYKKWVTWSQSTSADNFSEAACKKRWETFDSTKRRPITFASLIKETGYKKPIQLDAGKKSREDPAERATVDASTVPAEADTLAKFLVRYAYVPAGNFVLDRERPVDSALIDIAAFRNLTANQRVEVDCAVSKANPDGVKLEPIHKFWLCSEDRLTVEGEVYRPGDTNRLVQEPDGRLWLNTARFPRHTTVSEGDLSIFEAHLEYLMPVKAERQWFIQWMAFNVQRPAQRCKVTPLHISLPHGTGRGWIVECLEMLLGPWNVNKASMSELCGEGSKGQYHDYLSQSLVCCIEEVYEGGKRFTVSDTIRDKMTENRLNVNLKYGGKGTIDVYTNFFWMSNHNDALVIPAADRRITVIQGPDYVKDEAYYDALYDWLKVSDHVATLWHYLMGVDLSAFNWKSSTMTDAKRTMIEYNYTSTEEVFHEFLSEPPFPFMSLPQIVAAIDKLGNATGRPGGLEERQVRKLLQKMSPVNIQAQYRLPSGARVRPWVLIPGSDASDETVKESLLAAEEQFMGVGDF
ncbi:MAG: PriCT-2 domain-containing protein [Gammaproteobacteria bacterium]|nr:PriCT-2 domain-containing protein [Gammaproteobacteria bacterium]